MKKLYLPFALLFFASILFVNCNKDDEDEVVAADPFDLEREFGGADAVNILSEAVYTSLTIEIGYVAGSRPKQTSLDSLKMFINERAHKSGGITFVETVIPNQPAGPYTFDRLVEVEEEYRTVFRKDANLGLWIYMVKGDVFNDDGTTVDMSTLAAVYHNTSMYVVIPALERAVAGAPVSGYDGMESTTLQHEFGHWINLVNNLEEGDPDHPTSGEHESVGNKGHCKVETCLMYFESNNPYHAGYVSRVQRGYLVDLDPLCIADLRRKGGK